MKCPLLFVSIESNQVTAPMIHQKLLYPMRSFSVLRHDAHPNGNKEITSIIQSSFMYDIVYRIPYSCTSIAEIDIRTLHVQIRNGNHHVLEQSFRSTTTAALHCLCNTIPWPARSDDTTV